MPGAAVGGELGDRSPPPARRGRAVVRRATQLDRPLSAPADGGTERGRRSQQTSFGRRCQRARVRESRSAARHSTRRPRAAPLPPAASVAASLRAIGRCAAGSAPPADSEGRPPAGGAKPPARSDGLILRDSSRSASGLPRVSSMIRSRTRSSSRPGTARDSRARASGSSRPSSDSCGRPSSARVVPARAARRSSPSAPPPSAARRIRGPPTRLRRATARHPPGTGADASRPTRRGG